MSTQTNATSAPEAPTGLLCELLSHPETTIVTNTRPSFGWVVNDSRRGALQSAYQIIVAATEAAAQSARGDLWDSGKIVSENSINVPYGGGAMPENSTCWWSVRTWDAQDHPSPWSAPQKLNIGEPEDEFYSERWIDVPGRHDKVRANRHSLEVHSIAPTRIVHKDDGRYFIDFGRAAFAALRLTLTSRSDDHKITIHLGEKRGAGDSVDMNPGGSILHMTQQLTLKKGTHTYKLDLPRCNYGARMPEHIGEVRPFRYCEISNSPSEITTKNITQLAVYYRFDDRASSFRSSDHALNDVWELCKYSIKATSFLGIYVDGQRERLPYEADAYINQLGHYCTDREYAMARYSHEHLIKHPTWPTEWILFSVLIAWEDYLFTGNMDSINRCYDDLMKKMLLALAREDGLISTRTGLMTPEVVKSVHYKGKELQDIVDWPRPSESDGYVFAPINTVVNAFHYRALTLMSRMAAAVDRADDAQRLRSRAARVYESFNARLFDRAKGIYLDGEGVNHSSLHSNMFALAFGLVDDKKKPSVVEFIKSRGMACSVYGAQFLLEALYGVDEDETALRLMTNEGNRSWPHMVYDIGSTVTLEAWDPKFKPNLDWNHAWGAAPANVIPRLLVGVEPIEPGFRTVRVRPRIAGLSSVSAEIPTVRGGIKVSVERDEMRYRLRCAIPANTTAMIHLPASDASQVSEGGRAASESDGVSFAGIDKGRSVFRVGGGTYDFSVRQPNLH